MIEVLLALATAAGTADGVPFEKLAQTFRDQHGITGTLTQQSLGDALDRDYVSLALGSFDVRYPLSFLSDVKKGKDLLDIASALMDLQQHWMSWVDAGAKSERDPDFALVGKWLRGIKPGALAALVAKKTPERDLLTALNTDPTVTDAVLRLQAAMLGGESLGASRKDAHPIRLVLAPTRADFLGIASFVGSIDDGGKQLLWVSTLPAWTEFRRNDLQVLALEYGAMPSGKDDLFRGIDMNGREEKGLLQHVTQKAAELLLRDYYGTTLDPSLALGLAINLVIDLFGENNARAGGSGAGNVTSNYSKFVAGGKSSGGQLARRSADTRFRESKGRDHFVTALRTAQRQGAELAAKSDRSAKSDCVAFALIDPSPASTPACVRAPFLGEDANKDVPANVRNDYLEMLRAYKSCFAYWLQTKATGVDPEQTSAQLFAKSLHDGATFEPLYGVPLTSADPAVDSLESRFLKWLAKQK